MEGAGGGLYLGLDLGTLTGWGLMQISSGKGFGLISGVWDNSIKVGHDSPGLRFEKFAKQLDDILVMKPDRVFYELVRAHKGIKAGHIYGGLLAVMQQRCDVFGVPYEGMEVYAAKKFATGKGNASKEAVIDAVRLWGFNPRDDNEADAIAIVRCGWETRT